MGKGWWDVERRRAYASTGYKCAACDTHKRDAHYHQWLEAHELYDIDYPKGRMTLKEIVPLCHCCHNYIHSGRMQALVDKGEMEEGKMNFILNRGNRLIEMAGLQKPDPPTVMAPWHKWRLVFSGKEHPPKFPSYEDWLDHFYPDQFGRGCESDPFGLFEMD